MSLSAAGRELRSALRILGPIGTIKLLLDKRRKSGRLEDVRQKLALSSGRATLRESEPGKQRDTSEPETAAILERANAMLRDENYFFTFPYSLKVNDPWSYDPIERKHWPRRHYSERVLRAVDTPKDVKIVWEINRFKDLPALGQAAMLTSDERYAEEVKRRILSWIEGNPFGETINWASGLEVGIRLIAWSATFRLLREAGFAIDNIEAIQRSVWQQAVFLEAELSTDKIVRSNHLIGEAAALFVVSNWYRFDEAEGFLLRAKEILESEILSQTFEDGATREATSWYHQFVTHFFDLAQRVSPEGFSARYHERLSAMKSYLASLTLPKTGLVKYGDCDDGWEVYFEGDIARWKRFVFGGGDDRAQRQSHFAAAQQAILSASQSFCFVRGGAFGMGGDGFSSHAHDDQLSPHLVLDGLVVLTDPGTFVYNGDQKHRALYRGARAHNGFQLGVSPAVQKLNFGWKKGRADAKLEVEGTTKASGNYGEWANKHRRELELTPRALTVTDYLLMSDDCTSHLAFHLDPIWKLVSHSSHAFHFEADGRKLDIRLQGQNLTTHVESYDFSPSYRVKLPALVVRASAPTAPGTITTTIELR